MRPVFSVLAAAAAFIASAAFGADAVLWPTESRAFDRGEPFENFIQPTAGNLPPSGLFGDVRNGGYRFHEGIDIKSVRRDRKGEPLDDVYAAMDGKVVMANHVAGNSSYGRYVVLEHPQCDVAVYTLYAHLREIDPGVKAGAEVKAGARLGMMGRSATYKISRDCAHLHFEVGLRCGSNFDRWYNARNYKTKNRFGNFNGMNLVGMDPLDFMKAARDGRLDSGFGNYIKSQKTAFVVRFYTKKTPDFAKLYPGLVEDGGVKAGWDIYFTWFGLPQKMTRIKNPRIGATEGEFEITQYDPNEINRKCRRFISVDANGNLRHTKLLVDTLQKMF